MKNIVLTPQLLLREFDAEHDAAFLLELLHTPGWLSYIGDRKVETIEQAAAYISNRLSPSYTQYGFGMWLVILRSTQQAIGMCGLVRRSFIDSIDIGFALLPIYEGKGYAYEAAQACMQLAFDVFNTEVVSAYTVPHNKASIKLINKLGLQFATQHTEPDNDIVNIYTLSKADYKAKEYSEIKIEYLVSAESN
jgi:[ribosomal protein S5]-alanine N-acetyltransferase